MFKAYLSHAQLKEYLSLMLENGLLEYMQGEKRFKTTEKGIRFLRLNQDINGLTGFRQEKAVK
jgi:predicted transcriptional regulator